MYIYMASSTHRWELGLPRYQHRKAVLACKARSLDLLHGRSRPLDSVRLRPQPTVIHLLLGVIRRRRRCCSCCLFHWLVRCALLLCHKLDELALGELLSADRALAVLQATDRIAFQEVDGAILAEDVTAADRQAFVSVRHCLCR